MIFCKNYANFLDFTSPKKTQDETTVEDFKSRVGYLASDKLGGRSAGSKGDILARDYMIDLFEKSSSSVDPSSLSTSPAFFCLALGPVLSSSI